MKELYNYMTKNFKKDISIGSCSVVDEKGIIHGDYTQEIYRREIRPKHFWQYPKKDDPLCPKCRTPIIAQRTKEQETQRKLDYWNNLTEDQRYEITQQKKAKEQAQELRLMIGDDYE